MELEKYLKNGEYATLLEQKIRAKKEKMDALEESIAVASKNLTTLQDIKAAIGLAKKNAEYLDDTSLVKYEEQWDEAMKQIKELELLYMNSPDFKGYDHVTVRLNSLLWDAQSHIESMEDPNGENASLALARAKNEVEKVEGLINEFFSGTWNPLMESLIGAGLLPKKE